MITSMIGRVQTITPMDNNKFIDTKPFYLKRGEKHKVALIKSKDNPDETLNERAPNNIVTDTIVHE